MPLQRRLPKRGFKSAQLKYNGEVTLADLQRLGADEVDLLTLKAAGLVRELVKSVKVIKSGELSARSCSRASARRPVPRPPSKPPAAASLACRPESSEDARGNLANQLAKSGKFGDLRRRLVFLVLALVVYRIGAHIPVPGIDPAQLQQLFKGQQGGILNLFNMFSGGALSRFTVFALGIMPYISASIIMQLMTYVVPSARGLKKEGEAGRRKITQYTRYGTLLLAVFQSLGIALALEGSPGLVLAPGFGFRMTAVVSLVAGTMFLMWLGEQITERGLGNGISILIFAGIVAACPARSAGCSNWCAPVR
jgi:hypothetical protein